MWKMVSANLIKKSMLMGGFLTCNDSDILRAKTGPYRCIGYQTNIPPTLDMAPKWQTWAQHVSWPPSHQVCLRHRKLSEVVSRLILKLREVVPLAWETIYSLGEVMRVTSMGLPNLGLKSVTEV